MPIYDLEGNIVADDNGQPVAPRRRPRQMRPAAERARDPNRGVRSQALSELRAAPPIYDLQGNQVDVAGQLEAETAPNARRGERRRVTRPPVPMGGMISGAINLARDVGDYFTSNTDREAGAGEIAWQSVPEQDDVRWEGGALSGLLNALPREARVWLDAQGRANNIGLGYFLDFNQEHREQIIRNNVPTAEFRDDRWGNRMARMSPEQPWAYVNRPGFSSDDAITLAGEIEKYLLTRRLMPGGNAGQLPLGTSMLREGATGSLTTLGGQTLAMAVGGPGPDAVDVVGSGAGASAGTLVGHGIATAIRGGRSTPTLAQNFVRWLDDRLPSGAQRAAERSAQTEAEQAARIAAARSEAAARVQAEATQRNLTGERLQRAIATAEADAEAQVVREIDASGPGEGARALHRLAQSFGVRLTRAQTEADPNGVRFLYDAAQGHYGTSAQRLATAFLEEQGIALPAAIRGIAGDASVSSPQAAVSRARSGLESLQGDMAAQERAAWEQFQKHADRYLRTYDVTPAGNPGGVTRVRNNMQSVLREEGAFMDLPEYAANYPSVARVMALTERMAVATRGDLPLHDVDRVIQLKRFIDAAWEGAATAKERRLLTRLGTVTRDWLRDAAGYNEGVPAALKVRATQTAGHLRNALQISERNARTFRENPIIRDMLERGRPTSEGAQGHVQMTDQEVARRLFGGGEGGLNISGDSLAALRTLREALGPASPEWESIRQAALQRLTHGLDQAIVTRQTPLIVTTIKRIEQAFNANSEAMSVLFTPDELVRLRQAQRVVQALAPPGRNPVNASGTADTALRVGRGLLEMVTKNLRGVPFGPGEAARAAENTIAGARLSGELAGAAPESANVARAIADLWNVNRAIAGVGGVSGDLYSEMGPETNSDDGPREVVTYPEQPRPSAPRAFERSMTIEGDGGSAEITVGSDGRFWVGDHAFGTIGEAEAYARWLTAPRR